MKHAARLPPQPPGKSRVIFGLKLLISGVLLGGLVWRATGNETLAELWSQPKHWEWWLMAGGLVGLGYTLSFLRWWVLTSAVGLAMSPLQAIRWGLISQPFQLISLGVAGGDLLRIYYLCQRHRDRKTHVATTVLLDRAIGLTVMFAAVAAVGGAIDWSSLAAADGPRTLALRTMWWIAVGIVLTVGGVACVVGLRDFAPVPKWVLLAIPSHHGRTMVLQLRQLLPMYRAQPGGLWLAIGLSAANVVCLSGAVACVARGLTTEIPSWSDHLLIAPISLIAGAAPLPGGLGSQELVMSWLYAAFSTAERNTDYGFLVAVGFRLLTLLLAGLGWLLYLQTVTHSAGYPVRSPLHEVEDQR